jgi:ABC-type uncharacterized transport system permease subunit
MRAVSSLVALLLAAVVGVLSVVTSDSVVAGLALMMLLGVGIAFVSWRQSLRLVRRVRQISWPRVQIL